MKTREDEKQKYRESHIELLKLLFYVFLAFIGILLLGIFLPPHLNFLPTYFTLGVLNLSLFFSLLILRVLFSYREGVKHGVFEYSDLYFYSIASSIFFVPLSPITLFGAFYFASGKANETFSGIGEALYFSATTFVTLGFDDIAPQTALEKAAASIEGVLGYIFLGAILAVFLELAR